MGSRYGLLLASGARRYCRAAIRAALSLSLLRSPFLLPLPPLFAPSCASFSFSINGNGGVWGHEKKRDWSDGNPSVGLDAILRPCTRIPLAKNCIQLLLARCERFLSLYFQHSMQFLRLSMQKSISFVENYRIKYHNPINRTWVDNTLELILSIT